MEEAEYGQGRSALSSAAKLVLPPPGRAGEWARPEVRPRWRSAAVGPDREALGAGRFISSATTALPADGFVAVFRFFQKGGVCDAGRLAA